MRSHSSETTSQPLMSNSPTLGNVHSHTHDDVSGNSQSFNEVAEESPLEEEEEPQNPAPEEIPQPPDSTYVDEDAKGRVRQGWVLFSKIDAINRPFIHIVRTIFLANNSSAFTKTSINIGDTLKRTKRQHTHPGIFSTDCFQK